MARRPARYEWGTFLLFAGPNLVLFLVFTYWPLIYTAYLSLTDWTLPSPEKSFVGTDNFTAIWSDGAIWRVAWNTLVYGVCVVVAAQGLAFGLALLLNRDVPGRRFFRTMAFTPHVTATAAAALVWVLLLDPALGPLSFFYDIAGVEGPRFLASSSLALVAIIVVGIWREVGFVSVFFLAGLQGLPNECYEAATIDGAGPWQRTRHLTIPLLAPVFFFLSVSGFIASVKIFDTVAIMSEGGPVYPASSTFVYHLYRLAFLEYRMGYASAFAAVLFVLLGAMALIQLWLGRRIVGGVRV